MIGYVTENGSYRIRLKLQPWDPYAAPIRNATLKRQRKPRRPVRPAPAAQRTEPQVLLTARETAALLRISEITLARWRLCGTGPRFVRLGRRRIAYERSELLRWIGTHQHSSTSDPSSAAGRCR